MPSRTVSVTSNGVTSNVTIPDRDAVAGVKNYDVNGQSVTVNRTAPVIDSDRAGESRPLLSKVVGGATAAFSLRDLKDKQGNNKVIRVRREKDSEEKDFLAKDVPKIADWTNGLQETTLPADLPPTPSSITGFTVSGTDAEFNATYTFFGSQSNGKNKYVHSSESTREISYRSDGKWELDDDGDEYQVSVDVGRDYPWDVVDWVQGPEGSGGDPVFSNFLGGNPDNSPDVAFSLRKVNSAYTGHAVRIRRASDNVEVNVSFDTNDKVSTSSPIEDTTEVGGEIGSTTATTLGEFISGTNAAVQTWYDQSGNARHATQSQSDKQPLIAYAGRYLEELYFDGTNDSLATNQSAGVQVSNTESFALFGVVDVPNDARGYLFGTARNGFYTGSSLWVYTNLIFLTDGTMPRHYILRNSEEILVSNCYTSGDANIRVNGGGASIANTAYIFAANANFTIGSIEYGSGSDTFLEGSIKEIIGYASDQTANRFKIESNINNYYGIYTPDGGHGFVSRWYDQSGFNHHVSQGNSSTQPKIVTNGNLVVDGTGRTAISGTGAKLTFAPNKPVFSSDGTHSLFLVGDFNDQEFGDDNFADVVALTPLTQSGAANRKPRIILRQNDGRMVISTSSFDIADGNHSIFISLSDTLAANLISTIGNPNLSTANHVVHVNGVQKLSSNAHTIINTQTLTSGSAALFDQSETTVEHFLTEVIYYPFDQRLNRPAIEANIANQWGITLP